MYGVERRKSRAEKPQHTSEYLETYIPGDRVRMHETVCREKVVSGRPVTVLANGWGSNHSVLQRTAEDMAQRGEHVVTMDYPRRTLCPGNVLQPRQAALQAVIDALNDRYGRPVHLVGHSTGGIDGTRTAALYLAANMPGRISGFTMVSSAGILEDSTGLEVIHGALRETFTQSSGSLVNFLRNMGDLGLVGVGMVRDHRLLTAEAKEVIPTHVVPELLAMATVPGAPHVRLLRCAGDRLYRDDRVGRKLESVLAGTGIEAEIVQACHTDFTYAHPDILAAVSRHIDDTLGMPGYPHIPQDVSVSA